ncbi:MAG: hypothetical protein ACI4LM_04700 [Anaerovoracaceae bacterium]
MKTYRMKKFLVALLSALIVVSMMPAFIGTAGKAYADETPTVTIAGTPLEPGKCYKNVPESGKTTGVKEITSGDYDYYLSEDGTELKLNSVTTDAQLSNDPKNWIDVSGGTLTLSITGKNTVTSTGGAAISLNNSDLILKDGGSSEDSLTLDGSAGIAIDQENCTITSYTKKAILK